MKPSVLQLSKLIGNPGAYAVQSEDGSWSPVRRRLTPAVLRDHIEEKVTAGTYIVWGSKARTLVFDIDDADEAEQTVMLQDVTKVLREVKLPYGVEFSGRKGWHVWVRSEVYVPASTLLRIGRGVREEAGLPGLEVFPKQSNARDLGNLVKLPGGIHRVTGNANDFTDGGYPLPVTLADLNRVLVLYPEVRAKQGEHRTIEYPCVDKIQAGLEEGARNTALFHYAVMLRRASLNDENVDLLVRSANDAGDPLDELELSKLIDSSRYSGPVCDQLPDDLNCGEQCMKSKTPGLYTKDGRLKWAAVGQHVVMKVEARTEGGTVVELSHPDATQTRVNLKDKAPKASKEES